MPRKAKNPAAATVPTTKRVMVLEPIEDVEELRKSLRNAVVTALGEKSLGFTDERIPGNRIVFSLTGPSLQKAQAKYEYSVLPFLYLGRKAYWIAVTSEVEYKAGLGYLVAASVLVFEGNPSDPDKLPLLRAEWAHSDRQSEESHAQPHWHVYSGRLTQPAYRESDFFPVEEVTAFSPDASTEQTSGPENNWVGGEFFHFAMSSRWHEQRDCATYVQISPQGLCTWLSGCIPYIRAQIEYVHKGVAD